MNAKFMVYQEEIGEETGTYHLQGYVEVRKPVRHTHFRNWMEGAHFIKAQGTVQQNIDYCSKDPTRIGERFTFGSPAVTQGVRTDIIGLRDAVRSGVRGRGLYDRDDLVGPAVKYGRGVESMVNAFTTPIPRDDVVVTLHFGPAGTGKSHCCYSADAYLYDGNANGFWNGYKSETTVCAFTVPKEFNILCPYYKEIPLRGSLIITRGGPPWRGGPPPPLYISLTYISRSFLMSSVDTASSRLIFSEYATSIHTPSTLKEDPLRSLQVTSTFAVTIFPTSGGVTRLDSTRLRSTAVFK
ncbi:MAG: putative viral replication protein [Cressdnaviricota sp.]|nr:MAG: putative viral replication protein [Cressdnaviricota sp.]